MTAIAPVLQSFFTDRLMSQLHASPHTIASYRDKMRLLLAFARQQHGKEPGPAGLHRPRRAGDRRVPHPAGNRPRKRCHHPQPWLVAIHSLFRYASLHVPEHAELISRVLAIPGKRHDHPTVCFLTRRRSARCWQHRSPRSGPAAAITRC